MMENLSLNHNQEIYKEVDPQLISALYFRHIYKKVHEFKFNFLGEIIGGHRTGKSLCGLTLADALDPSFSPEMEKRVVFFPQDFMKALDDIKQKEIIGGCVLFDEAGVGLPARDWYELSNKAISYSMQVVGRYRPIIFFITQNVSYIDSQPRKLFTSFFEMSRNNNEYATLKPFRVQINQRRNVNRIIYKYPRFALPSEFTIGNRITLKRIRVHRPPQELEDRYENHSKDFKNKIIQQMKERTERFNAGEIDSRKMTFEEIVNTCFENRQNKKYLSKRSTEQNVIFDQNAIKHIFDLPSNVAQLIKRRAELLSNGETTLEKTTEDLPKDW